MEYPGGLQRPRLATIYTQHTTVHLVIKSSSTVWWWHLGNLPLSFLLGRSISLQVDIGKTCIASNPHHITIVQSIWWQMPNSSRENINWWKVRWSDNSHYCHRRILKLTKTQKCDFNDGWCNIAMGCKTERGPSKRFSALKFQCFSGFMGNVTIQ